MPAKRRGKTSSLSPVIHEQIDAILAGRSTALSLDYNSIESSELASEIGRLTGLRTLSLGESPIERLPPWLADLPNLEEVDISESHVTELPSFLRGARWGVNAGQAFDFRHQLDPSRIISIRIDFDALPQTVQHVFDLGRAGTLELSRFRAAAGVSIGSGPDHWPKWASLDIINRRIDEFLGGQQGLRELWVFGCPIGRIPEPIRQMRALTKIILGVWSATIPAWLFEAPELTELRLGYNNVSGLPHFLGEAPRLKVIGLNNNPLRHIPSGIWNFTALEFIGLEGCPIKEIPPDILRLPRLSTLAFDPLSFKSDDMKSPPKELLVPPPEIAAQGVDAIKRYWLQERDAGVDYLAEAKLLIVGEPGAGKTSLAKKILDPGYRLAADEDSTEGIDVLPWQFPAAIRVRDQAGERLLERDFRVNIWDFGGQEIYHSTHQFFLTKRSVYVLVTDERKEDTDFEYWLEIVSLLSDGSPMLIVQNHKQKRHHGVDFGALRQRYPNLRETLTLDLADNSGLEQAVARIRRELEQLPHIGTALPATWRAVRLALEADERNYISAADFFAVCAANGFTDLDDMRQLGGYLHDLGICLFFQDDALLSKTVILKPEWGTTAVYRVLDDPQVAQAVGEFTRADLRRIWSDASYQPMLDELLQLMVKFQLCYRVPGSDTYIAPQLLTPSQPAYHWDESDNLVLRYEYDVMPKGIVRRLIVALHFQIAPDAPLWRSGAVFEYEGSRAEVIEVYRRRTLTIRIRGGDPRVLLGLIDHELATIHRSYPGIRFKKFTPCDCETCSASGEPTMFEMGDLVDFARTGDQIQCRASRRLRDPHELLRMISPDLLGRRHGLSGISQGIPQPEPVQPEIFVSYSWGGDSEALVDEIQATMADRGVLITRDKSELRYRDSIDQFMDRIGAGKCIIVILGKAYLESKFCMYELTQIANHPEFARRVYPIVLPDAGISDARTRIGYIRYWEQQQADLDADMKTVGQEYLDGIREDLDLYADIRRTIARLMDVLADMNTLTPVMHRGTGFDQLYTQLAAALQV